MDYISYIFYLLFVSFLITVVIVLPMTTAIFLIFPWTGRKPWGWVLLAFTTSWSFPLLCYNSITLGDPPDHQEVYQLALLIVFPCYILSVPVAIRKFRKMPPA